MTLSGKSVYKDIKERVQEVEDEHENLSQAVYSCEANIESLVSEMENCYTQLATVYLPEMTAQCVKETLKQVQGDVQKIFKAKQERRIELENSMKDSTKKKKTLESELENVTEQLNQKASERDKLRKEIVEELNGNQGYMSMVSESRQDGERLAKNQERLKEFKAEAEQKLPQYQKNNIFMYLLNRKFGASDYQEKGIAKMLDSGVAKIVNYAEMKKNFDFLHSMPELTKIEFERRKEELESLVEKVQGIEKDAADKHGLTAVLESGKETAKKREVIMTEIAGLDAEYRQYSQERSGLDNTKDRYHGDAVKKLKDYLKGDDISELKTLARATPGTEDDRIVTRLEDIDKQVRIFKDKSKQAKAKRDEIGGKLDELNEIKNKYTSKNFDSERSYFDSGFDITPLLIGYIIGQSSATWNHIEEHQHFRREESYSSHHSSDSYGGGYSHHDSGGGFGGGGFSGGGGFGGGGFSSGHGF